MMEANVLKMMLIAAGGAFLVLNLMQLAQNHTLRQKLRYWKNLAQNALPHVKEMKERVNTLEEQRRVKPLRYYRPRAGATVPPPPLQKTPPTA